MVRAPAGRHLLARMQPRAHLQRPRVTRQVRPLPGELGAIWLSKSGSQLASYTGDKKACIVLRGLRTGAARRCGCHGNDACTNMCAGLWEHLSTWCSIVDQRHDLDTYTVGPQHQRCPWTCILALKLI